MLSTSRVPSSLNSISSGRHRLFGSRDVICAEGVRNGPLALLFYLFIFLRHVSNSHFNKNCGLHSNHLGRAGAGDHSNGVTASGCPGGGWEENYTKEGLVLFPCQAVCTR